jgi:transposase
VVVPDNLKSGVNKACHYDPDINPTYQDMATHYSTVVLPARVREPRDKAKVETGVQVVERWILARLRNHTFFSLTELNQEMRKLLDILNNRSFKKLPGTRKSLFESLDHPALKPLLQHHYYQYAECKKATVHIDDHVELDGHYYSVPYQLVRKKVDVRFTSTTVECLHKGRRVADHCRSYQKGRHTTVREHMPPRHGNYLEWTPERFVRWAGKIGPQTVFLAEHVLTGHIRSRPTAAFSASCVSGKATLTNAWKLPASGRFLSAPHPLAASSRF